MGVLLLCGDGSELMAIHTGKNCKSRIENIANHWL